MFYCTATKNGSSKQNTHYDSNYAKCISVYIEALGKHQKICQLSITVIMYDPVGL